jgi:phosphatidylserine/phosphatidylglycerophosphate/cardiolipin synthase-like enzyme
MRTKLIGVALAAVGLGVVLAGGTPASAAGNTITTFFNSPTDNLVIQNATIDLIKAAPKASYIRMAMYHLTMASVGDALTAAHARGVHVQMVLDTSAVTSPVVAKLTTLLGSDPAKTDFVVLYSPPGAIMHNKFVLFSSPMMVVDSTANFTSTHTWNGAIVAHGYPVYYKSYVTRFVLLAHKMAGTFTMTPDGNLKSYFFPEPKGDDAWVGILKNFAPKGARIDIAMYNFTDQDLADKLNYMAAHGTHIRIASTNLLVTLSPAIVQRHYSEASGVFVHAKELIVHGTYNGTAGSYQLWLGSTNFTHTGINHNAENTTRVSDRTTWNKFEANFNMIFDSAPTVRPAP